MNDDRNLPDHLEDVPERPIDSDRVLSDDELQAGGLQPVKAYVRTKAGKAAQRQQRYREKKEAEGFKQTNVQVPDEHQEMIREIARKLREGEPVAPETALTDADRRLLSVAHGDGFRSRLIRLLAGV